MKIVEFQKLIWDYYREHGRDLPWRRTQDPYAIFVSEVMLQQTQVSRVIYHFPIFISQFPDFATLADSSLSDVLARWQGMGYNRRALWMRQAALAVVRGYAGQLPSDPAELIKLPGIGPNTAGSIAAFAFNQPAIFIETNIRRVFIHYFFDSTQPSTYHVELVETSHQPMPDPSTTLRMTDQKISDREILPLIAKTLDQDNPREWYFALMDYGSELAKSVPNPNRRSRHYAKQSSFEGSRRQKRAQILRLLVNQALSLDELSQQLNQPTAVLKPIADELVKEGFIIKRRAGYSLVQ